MKCVKEIHKSIFVFLGFLKYGLNDILECYAIQIMCDFWIFEQSFTKKEEGYREARIQCNKILPPGSDWNSDSDECKRMEKLYKGGRITRGRGNKEEFIGRAPSLGVGWVYPKVHCRGWPFCVVATSCWLTFWKFRHTAWAVGSCSSGSPAARSAWTKSTGNCYHAEWSPCIWENLSRCEVCSLSWLF